MRDASAFKLSHNESGLTLLEILLVIGIIAVAYAVGVPLFDVVTGADKSKILGQVAADVRSAFDMAVLSGKPHRIVFEFRANQYWLEVADRQRIFISDEKVNNDPTESDEKAMLEDFEQNFQEYEDLAGEEVTDPDSDDVIQPTSPVLDAKAKLKPAKWVRAGDLEWNAPRNIDPFVLLSVQSEHHGRPQSIEENGEEARAFIYFFPQGYVQKAVIKISETGEDCDTNPADCYTVVTEPSEGVAVVHPGVVQVEFEDGF